MLTDGPGLRRSSARIASAILTVTLATQIGLFALHTIDRCRFVLANPLPPPAIFGEGAIIRGDGLGYYAWLRSLLFDHDWSFDNEFDDFNATGSGVPPKDIRTALGLRTNQWSVGPAIVWAATVVPAHAVLAGATGYELPYQVMVGATTLVASIVGTWFFYGLCRQFARSERAALAAAFMTLGTTVLYYGSVDGSMAHGAATAALAGYVWYWLRTYGSSRPTRWLLLGVLLGVVALMRWQLATYGLLPAGEALLTLRQMGWRRTCGLWVLFTIGAVIGFAPQMVAWRCVYGSWMTAPVTLTHHWLRPDFWAVLATTNRGFLYWTPIVGVACVGFGFARHRPQLALLALAFAAQVYALASIRGTYVDLGASFGYRYLTESYVALAPGLAILLERANETWFRRIVALGCGLVYWNLLLIDQFCHFILPPEAGGGPGQLLAGLWQLLHRRPVEVGAFAVVPVLLTLLAFRCAVRVPAQSVAGTIADHRTLTRARSA
jgi:hypothetical protein